MRPCRSVAVLMAFAGLAAPLRAQELPTRPDWGLPLPEVRPDPKVPTLKKVVGHDWAEEISAHAQIERYLQALADAAPDRCRLVRYGESAERRAMWYAVISSPANIERLESIRADNLKLGDPRRLKPEQADDLAAGLPAIVWLSHSVHGDETSSSDAALLTAYTLLADTRPATRELLEKVVVIIDPLQNPDGRERFLNNYREARGVFDQADPAASEHIPRWIPGRLSHYHFDMNRDWFLQTQRESKAKVKAWLSWTPHLFIDAHEMGRSALYYFDPPAEPFISFITPSQRELMSKVGKAQAAWFDRLGFGYTSREVYDAFYPGYGSTWPVMLGSMGILWEQAGTLGQIIERDDGLTQRYRDAVLHHYASALATLEYAGRDAKGLIGAFRAGRTEGVKLGADGPIKTFALVEKPDPGRARSLAALLVANGIEVRRTKAEATLAGTWSGQSKAGSQKVPAGSYLVSVAQPGGRLVRALLDDHADMPADFIKEQVRHKDRRIRTEIYDVTAWSLPLTFGVDSLACTEDAASVASEPFDPAGSKPTMSDAPAPKVAYVVDGSTDNALPALTGWLRQGFRVHVLSRATTIGGQEFAPGALVLKVAENPANVHDSVRAAEQTHRLRVARTDTGYVDVGAHFSGTRSKWIRPPRVAMLIDRPVHPDAGHTWYLFDQVWDYPITRVPVPALNRLDLKKYDVLILADGRYARSGEVASRQFIDRLDTWVREGGTLILVKGAASWAATAEVNLLATRSERIIEPTPAVEPAATKSLDPSRPPIPEEAGRPLPVPGAILRATVEDEHFVTFGLGSRMMVLSNSGVILAPIKPADGRNLVSFEGNKDALLAAGFCWDDTKNMIAGKPYVIYQRRREGHIIAFTGDPNFRAASPSTQRLFFNAVFLGPAHKNPRDPDAEEEGGDEFR